MTPKIRAAVVQYLETLITIDPQINPQKMGECIYCDAALDEGELHKDNCHYAEAKRLLVKFKSLA